MRLTKDEFATLVEGALDELPSDIRAHMDNVAVTISDWPDPAELQRAGIPSRWQLFGLYEGIPLVHRRSGYMLVPPDKITLFQGPIEAASGTVEDLRRRIVRTVIHEVAHHFGLDDARIAELSGKD